MLKTYFGGSSTLAGLVNETSPNGACDHFRPGDLVRRQMFDEDISLNIVIPIGFIVWSITNASGMQDVGIVWPDSGES